MQRNALVTLPSPLDPGATVTVAKAGYVTNVDGPEVRSGPPVLGADTNDILAELGFETNEIERLRNAGVI
jgi:crotonobetainyl-CoA:carnitine CoA-transferase CaiB-like acyl-CoA transferase